MHIHNSIFYAERPPCRGVASAAGAGGPMAAAPARSARNLVLVELGVDERFEFDERAAASPPSAWSFSLLRGRGEHHEAHDAFAVDDFAVFST